MGERDDVFHPASDARENRLDVLERLPRLDPHVPRAHNLTLPIQGHLPFQIHDLTGPLDDAHREGPEGRPHARRIEAIDHPMPPSRSKPQVKTGQAKTGARRAHSRRLGPPALRACVRVRAVVYSESCRPTVARSTISEPKGTPTPCSE